MKNNINSFVRSNGLVLVLVLAFIVRMVFYFSLQPWDSDVVNNSIVVSDAKLYHQLAISFLSDHSFEGFGTLRTPGYPLFIALIFGVSSNSVWLVLLIQILLSLFSVYFVYRIARVVYSKGIAILSALIFAIDIHQVLYTISLLSETVFVFLFLASLLFLIKGIAENHILQILLSAFVLGIATLVRPAVTLFPFVVCLFIFWVPISRQRVKILYSALYIAVFIAAISPWLIHNYQKHRVVNISSQAGSNLLFSNVTFTEAYVSGKSIEQVEKDFYCEAIERGADTSKSDSYKNSTIYSEIAKEYIADNFGVFCKRHFMGIVNMYAGLATKHIASVFHAQTTNLRIRQEKAPNILRRIIEFIQVKSIDELFIGLWVAMFLIINYALALFGIFIQIRRKHWLSLIFIFIIIYFSLLTGAIGCTRLRASFMPSINILCAVGFFTLYSKFFGVENSNRELPLKSK